MENLPFLSVVDLPKDKTAVVVIDMINGFAKKGALYSERIEGIIPYLVKTLPLFDGYQKVFFADAHNEDSKEFASYPVHCLKGTEESEVIEELKSFLDDNGTLCYKSSTNGFVSKDFAEWMMKNPEITNYVLVGDCTDLCVLQFALSIKGYFNEWNVTSNIIVPVQGVETFDLEKTNHQAELMNVFSLYNMRANGIQLVNDIRA
ncbi:cysteine hydrolase (plasmid) [Aneurinibacillus sp. Ricciae_BoGa-3]|uniref:isochorismatase family cysteine hydrolase n=1 Tax=Aneurinibacillus sp. Ricciae_BoGa-3 TaxID=3022697 RepID=UPI002340CE5A|nr:isochorismatase family cysteine hydrolase [Aneurinibacillus sp. Ricciae_BoGa-3]WCK57585.1 cysteine hydrolase [Aneurinibacillus sp. Ricciae_BoGa-3]